MKLEKGQKVCDDTAQRKTITLVKVNSRKSHATSSNVIKLNVANA
jgi:hypothetical protein